MIRGLLIAMNFFIAWFISMLAGVPSATVTAPDNVNKGESFTVNVKIDPSGVEDFLRFSMTLPDGWTAEKIEEDGSSFMFEKQTVKFLWSRVGPRSQLNISFRITPPSDAEGTFEFPCKVSHSVDNLPSHIQLDPLKVIVGNAGTPNNGNYVPETSDSTANPATNVTVTRTVPTEPVNGEFLVDVTINKGELGNFIKLQDSLPDGFIAKPVTNDGGDWSFENGVVRVQWYSPNKSVSTLHIQYKVIVSPDVTGRYTINGHVSYLENMENKLVNIAPSQIELKENPALANNQNTGNTGNTGDVGNTGNTGNTGDVGNTGTAGNTGDVGNTGNTGNTGDVGNTGNTGDVGNTGNTGNTGNNGNKTEDPLANNNQNNGNQIGDANAQNNQQLNAQVAGVFYAVQLAAMNNPLSSAYFASNFGISQVDAVQDQGLNKYITGRYANYKEARDYREVVRGKGVYAPFVVAYSSGKRITVQEALMITSQKWIL